MLSKEQIISIEDQVSIGFFRKQGLVIERGEGCQVFDTGGNMYLDFTSGWGVTCLGHSHPVITAAIIEQSRKIIQNPNAGLSYSPPRARALQQLAPLLPANLTRVFFTNSGAEANDAAIKLARKITGRKRVAAMENGFHGRTLNTYAATGNKSKSQAFGGELLPVDFVPFNNIDAVATVLANGDIAALIVEPIQGEGGVNPAAPNYLETVSSLCKQRGTLLIVDEIQTGFCRTGKFFATTGLEMNIDFLTMAKGLGGGFPVGAFAASQQIAEQIDVGDHGGTYCGNPLACAVVEAVVGYLVKENIAHHVQILGQLALAQLQEHLPKADIVKDIRGQGLLLAIEFSSEKTACLVVNECQQQGLLVTLTQGNMLRIFPALTISKEELLKGIGCLIDVINQFETSAIIK